jgi:SnoaL-like domain
MSDVEQFSLRRAADRLEIQHRIYQFCRAVDRLDLEIARDAFHPDALDDHGVFKGGVDDLFDWVRRRHADLPFSYHHVGNIFIEFSSDDEAMCESYVLTWQSVSPAANILADGGATNGDGRVFETIAAGRYVDHFTRRDGAWRIQKRISFPESAMIVPEPSSGKLSFGTQWAKPTRDRSDPSQRLRALLGL